MSLSDLIAAIPFQIYLVLSVLPLLFILMVIINIWRNKSILKYDLKRGESMIRIEVTVTKKEGGSDKEKETQKDHKEMVGLMDQMISVFHSLHKFHGSFFKGQDYFGFEIGAKANEEGNVFITFQILIPKNLKDFAIDQITSFYPDANIEILENYSILDDETEKAGENKKVVDAISVVQSRPICLPLKTYDQQPSDPLNVIINAFSVVKPGESLAMQLMCRPANENWIELARPKVHKLEMGAGMERDNYIIDTIKLWLGMETGFRGGTGPQDKGGTALMQHALNPVDQQMIEAIGEKIKKAGFNTTIKIISQAKDQETAMRYVDGVMGSLSQYNDPSHNQFIALRGKRVRNKVISAYKHNLFDIPGRFYIFAWKYNLLSSADISSMFHFPHKLYNQHPAIKWSQFKLTPAPANMPNEGILLGYNEFHGVKTKIHIKRVDRTRHMYVIGKSGSGKSVLLEWMIRQDIKNGDGVCVMDPHGDLAKSILNYIPSERAKDVVYFDAADITRPMGLNLLDAKKEQRELASQEALAIFIKMFGEEIFSPRLQHYFRNASLTLMEDEDEGATLLDIARIFVDDKYLAGKLAKVKNPAVRAFWEQEYAKTGQREKQEMIPYFSSKFGPFVSNTVIRNIIGQAKSSFDFRQIMDNQKILLVSLSKGMIGELNMQLLGLIMVSKIAMAAMSRVDIPEEERKNFYFYVDEFQNFATDSFESILSEARKYHLNLIVAHQYIAQLEDEIRDAVFGNVGTMLSFKVGAADAEYLAKEYAPVYNEQDILSIGNYKAYIRLCIDNATSQAFSMASIYEPEGKNKGLAQVMREISRLRNGRDKKFVDIETTERVSGLEIEEEKISQPLPERLEKIEKKF